MFRENPEVVTRKLLGTSSLTVAGDRIVDVICSTGDPDRMGDILVQKGINLKPYGTNPIVLWNHLADVPIARSIEIGVRNEKLQAKVKFPPEGEDEDSDWVYGKIKAGIVNATSVGFIPKDYEPIDPKKPWNGFKFKTSELLEFSFVSVPANSGCLIVGRSMFKGVDIPLLPSRARLNAPAARIREAHALAARARALCTSIVDEPPPTREQRIAEARNFRRIAMAHNR
jgi:HK97 family phage prohead protease